MLASSGRGAWSIPKENSLARIRRMWRDANSGKSSALADSPSGLWVRSGSASIAVAVEANLDAEAISSNTFEMEWPPKSGRRKSFPEVDRAEGVIWRARERRFLASQQPLLDRLDEDPDRQLI